MKFYNLKSIMDNARSPMGIVEGTDHIYTYANTAFLKLFNGKDVLQLRAKDAHPQVVMNGLIKKLDKIYSSGEEYRSKEEPHILNIDGKTTKLFKDYMLLPIRDAKGDISGIYIQIDDVTNQVRLQNYNEVLLQELDHRVRNNIAIILSILQLQANEIKNQNHLEPFLDAQKRIRVFSKIHELVFCQNDMKNIPMHKLIKRLADQELNLFSPDQTGITVEVEDFYININQAVLLGLICNEIISYASKRLSNGRKRSVTITSDIQNMPEISLYISIENIGEQYPEDKILWDDNLFEAKLVNILAMQLKANLKHYQGNNLTTLGLTFTKAEIIGSAAGYFIDKKEPDFLRKINQLS